MNFVSFPEGYALVVNTLLMNKTNIFFLTSPSTQESQIGFMENNDCVYVC
jgi:hypothetical protein